MVLAVDRLVQSRPMLVAVVRAREVSPHLAAGGLLHAGPPLGADRPPGPMRGALVGALILEGTERDIAESKVDASDLELAPCQDHGFVGPMAGVVSASMPVFVVRDAEHGNYAYATLNEGLGRTLRFGANEDAVLERLRWLGEGLAPQLERVLLARGPIALKPLLAEGLRRGDELHNRNKATTAQFVRDLAPDLVETAGSGALETLRFLRDNDHFCLNLSIAASKCAADAAHSTGQGPIVTAMASNGVDFGIKVAGLGDRWFTAPANHATGQFFGDFTAADAAADMGDSYVSEVVGLGGFAMAAAPAIASFVGGTPSEFAQYTHQMYEITQTEHPDFRIPTLDYRGVPCGIDISKVVDTGTLPVLNSGIAHQDAGVGQIGAGITSPPVECFREALSDLSAASNN